MGGGTWARQILLASHLQNLLVQKAEISLFRAYTWAFICIFSALMVDISPWGFFSSELSGQDESPV